VASNPAAQSDVACESADPSAVARGLDRCPVCNYSLNGLPLAHRCPECGFEYDEQSRAWRPRKRPGRSVLAWVFAVWFLMSVVPGIIQAIQTMTGLQLLYTVGAPAIVVLLGLGIGLFHFRRRPFVAAAPRGVFIRLGVRPMFVVPWAHVRGIEAILPNTVRDEKMVYILLREGRPRIDISGVVQGIGTADRIVAEFRSAMDYYRTLSSRPHEA
jgi:hypothetical protein